MSWDVDTLPRAHAYQVKLKCTENDSNHHRDRELSRQRDMQLSIVKYKVVYKIVPNSLLNNILALF